MATKSLIMMSFLVVVLVLVSFSEKVKGSEEAASGPIFDFSNCKSDKDCNHPTFQCPKKCKHCYCNNFNLCSCIRKTHI
ncbi:hypothetical protein M5689_017645 [Euphorbia peplus]|nr:hypothetical protein M5689_017645 [Euphorbia peplus]